MEKSGEPQQYLMGVLRCVVEHHDHRKLSGYKKRFWVVVPAVGGGHMEMYKNDQAHVPQKIIKAKDIREVMYAGDKQNRFFVLIVQTRKHHNIKFRMNSCEERERWSAAITRLMEECSSQNRKASLIELVRRRVTDLGKRLGVTIAVDAARLYNVPTDLSPYIIEAIDLALNNISELVSYRSDLVIPKNYTLHMQQGEVHDLRYDPLKQSIVLNICLYRDNFGEVQTSVTPTEKVLQMLQSDVYRDPVIEGWTDNARCTEIAQFLGKTGKVVGLEWNRHVSDRAKVEAYLECFVTDDFLNGILDTLKATVTEFEHLIEAHQAQFGSHVFKGTGAGNAPRLTPRAPLHLSHAAVPSSTGIGDTPGTTAAAAGTGTTAHSGGTGTVHGGSSSGGGGGCAGDPTSPFGIFTTGGGGLAAFRNNASVVSSKAASLAEDAVALEAFARSLFSDNIAGLAIQLSKDTVERCARPPDVKVSHTPEYEQHCRPAFCLVGHFQCVLLGPEKRESVLHTQLFEVALNALLYRLMVSLRAAVSAVFDKRVKVIVAWNTLPLVLQRLGKKLDLVDLLHLVSSIQDMYVPRLQFIAQTLGHALRTTTVVEDGDTTLYDTFCQCVCGITVHFACFDSDKRSPPSPNIVDGMLHDCLLCALPHDVAMLLMTVNAARGTTARYAPVLVPGVCVCAATPKLAAWCEQYFSKPEHYVPCQDRHVADEFDFDTNDVGLCDPFEVNVDDDEVAKERNAEIRVLNMQRAVNMIYDSQGSTVDLKVSVEDIHQAVHSLEEAFGGRHISKHDLVRVFVNNLHHLRNMYIGAAEINEVLSETEALQLLRNFCEYRESEDGLEDLLEQRRGSAVFTDMVPSAAPMRREVTAIGTIGGSINSRRHHSITTLPPVGSDSLYSTGYRFPSIARIALNYLLPREAVTSRKAWRVGLLFGLENTGKTLITNSIRGLARPTTATVGLSKQVVAFEEWIFALNELGGRASFRDNWRYYVTRMDEVHFLLFVVDSQNKRRFHEARQYLRGVARFFTNVPLLIVFNNYREPRFHQNPDSDNAVMKQLKDAIGVPERIHDNAKRAVIVCKCDISVVHESNRVLPSGLQRALLKLSEVLKENSPPDRIPQVPKNSAQVSSTETESESLDPSI